MDLVELERKLIAAARANPPSDTVPVAFEKRVMARLTELHAPEYAVFWARGLWRGAFASIAAAVVAFALHMIVAPRADESELFADQFESAMLAAVDQEQEVDL